MSPKRPAAIQKAAELLQRRSFANVAKAPLPEHLDALDRFLVGTHSTHPMPRQAELLGVPASAIHFWRRRLYAAGLLCREERAAGRPVTLRETAAVRRMICDGYSRSEICVMREISPHRLARLLRGTSSRPLVPRNLNATQVEQILGTCRLYAWIDAGWLPDYRLTGDRGVAHSYTMDDLVALVQNRATWPAWDPPQIGDPTLRRIAEQVRAAAGGAWLQRGELAALLGVNTSTLYRWIETYGLFKNMPICQYGASTYRWLTNQQQAELHAWAADAHRSSLRSDAHRWAANALRQRLIAAYGTRQSSAAAD